MKLDEVADLINKFRIFPRLLVVSSTTYIGWYMWQVGDWYMSITTPGIEESGFAASVVTLLAGIVKFMIDKYMNTGGPNDK